LTEVNAGEPTQLEAFQIAYLLDDSRYKITNKTRQAGGSLVVSMAKFWKCYRNEQTNCDIVSINRAEAQGKITYIRNLWESLPARWRHPLAIDNAEKIAFHAGRRMSTIRSIAASAGVRGGRKDIVFDEAAHIPLFESLFVAALPATVRARGGFDVVSTPMGQVGKFFEIWNNFENRYEDWARHAFVWIDVSQFCRACDEAREVFESEFEGNPDALVNFGELYEEYATPELKKVGRNFTSEEFLQEFCGKFVDESTAYFPYSLIDPCRKHAEPQPLPNGSLDDFNVLKPWLTGKPEDNENDVTMGIDFAEGRKGGDSTSVQVIEKERDGRLLQRYYADLDHTSGYDDFDKQMTEFNRLIDVFHPVRVSVDETGLGRKIAADLKKAHGGLIEPITFTHQNKEAMALNLRGLLETHKLWLQYENKRIRGQFHNIKRKITSHGNVTYSGEPHDDMFWAMALACKGAGKSRFQILTLDDDSPISG
jgi:phage FluMu gp28-like protein